MSELQPQEMSDLKLELNQQQQVRASLELELRQREEIIIKMEAEAQRREIAIRQELKALTDKLHEKNNSVGTDEEQLRLQDDLQKSRAREKQLSETVAALTQKQATFEKIMNEYENTLANKMNEIEKIKSESETAKRHLSNVEMAFSDVHQKYERSKTLIEGYKTNEEMLQQGLINSSEATRKNEEKYDSLKAHAKAQIDKSNKELIMNRDKHQAEILKMATIIKRLEIKNASIVQALDQKTNECAELAALCNEVTGRID